MGTLSGALALSAPATPTELLRTALAHVKRANQDFSQKTTDDWKSSAAFTRTFKALREALAAMEAAIMLFRELEGFTQPDNLARIAAWSQVEAEAWPNSGLEQPVKAERRALVGENRGSFVALPANYTVPSRRPLQELREIVGKIADADINRALGASKTQQQPRY